MATTTDTLEVTCPRCGRTKWVEAEQAGRKTSCGLCQEVFRVPAPGEAAPPARVAKRRTPTPPSPIRRPVPAPAPIAAPPVVEALPDSLFEPPAAHRRQPVTTDPFARSGPSRDLEAEAHLVAIAIWQRVWCVLGLIFAAVLYKLTVAMSAAFGEAGFSVSGPGALRIVAIPVLGALASGALGHFLARYHAAARLLTVGLAALTVVFTLWDGISILSVLSVLFDIAVIVVLLNPRSVAVCTPEYRDTVARSPDVSVPWASSPFFWIPAVLTLLLVGVGLFSAMATAAFLR